MKLLSAIVQPHKLEDVKAALEGLGVQGMTVTEVKGFGRQKGHKDFYRGAEYKIDFVPKVRIDVAVKNEIYEEALAAIERSAKSGKIGDGKVFVLDVVQAVRIRTGERGESAL